MAVARSQSARVVALIFACGSAKLAVAWDSVIQAAVADHDASRIVPGRVLIYADDIAIAQAHLAGHHHLISFLEARDDFNSKASHSTSRSEPRGHPERDLSASITKNRRLVSYGIWLIALPGTTSAVRPTHQSGVSGYPFFQAKIRVLESHIDPKSTRRGVYYVVNLTDCATEYFSGKSICTDLSLHPGVDISKLVLRDCRIHEYGIEHPQLNQIVINPANFTRVNAAETRRPR